MFEMYKKIMSEYQKYIQQLNNLNKKLFSIDKKMHSSETKLIDQISIKNHNSTIVFSQNYLDPNKTKNHVKQPKKIVKKLQNLIKTLYQLKLKSIDKTQNNHIVQRNKQNILKRILQKYTHYYSLRRDGNSFYRILAIHHLQRLLKYQNQLHHFYSIILKDQFQISKISNYQNKYQELMTKQKLIQTFKIIITFLSKSYNKNSENSIKTIANLINGYGNFDFCLIAIYRLYVFYEGYKKLFSQLQNICNGCQDEQILIFNMQISQVVIKICVQALSCQINIYEIYGMQIQKTVYKSQKKQQQIASQNIKTQDFVIDLLYINKCYCVMDKIIQKVSNQDKKDKNKTESQQDILNKKQFQLISTHINNNGILSDINNKKYEQDPNQNATAFLQVNNSFISQKNYTLSPTITIQKYTSQNPNKNFTIINNVQQTIFPIKQNNQLSQSRISNISSGRKVGSIKKQNNLNDTKNYKLEFDLQQRFGFSKFLELKQEENRFYQQIYSRLSESQIKQLVIKALRAKFQQKYQQDNNFKINLTLYHQKETFTRSPTIGSIYTSRSKYNPYRNLKYSRNL